jgi:hypothetical protein
VVGHGETSTTLDGLPGACMPNVGIDASAHSQSRREDIELQPVRPLPPVPAQSAVAPLFRAKTNGPGKPLGPEWRAFAQASVPVVKKLMDVYFETVYPMYAFPIV